MSEPFLAEIIMFGGTFAPRSWALCDGQILPINQNQSLYSLLGTTYGGDGRTSFALPDMRGRIPIHSGGGSAGPGLTGRPLGARFGNEESILTLAEMPNHSHAPNNTASVPIPSGDEEDDANPSGRVPGPSADGNLYGSAGGAGTTVAMGTTVKQVPATVGNTGTAQPANNLQPYTVINFIIALQGLFPSRN